MPGAMITDSDLFQSTRPARGATQSHHVHRLQQSVSIHAPREGRDADMDSAYAFAYWFQSTRPARGATVFVVDMFAG